MLRRKRKVFIFCNGCARRSLDTSRITDYFKANNCIIVPSPEKADYIIFITCGFSDKEGKSFELIEKFSKHKGELIVVGCLPDMAHVQFREKFKGKFIETRNLEAIDKLFNDFKVKFSQVSDAHYLHTVLSKKSLPRRLYHFVKNKSPFKNFLHFFRKKIKKIQKPNEEEYLRISNGCLEKCAYCSIWRAVGKFRSKSLEECMSEYAELLKKGQRNIAFIADNLGPYGLDTGTDLNVLIEKLSSIDKDMSVKWRFEEMHPRWVIKYRDTLSKLIAEGKLTELICGLQSGDNRILKLMNRHHTIEEIIETLSSFKKINPAFKLYTQVIIGFPSETEEEFFETVNALKKIKFESIYLFPYHDGIGSTASTMPEKIDQGVIAQRVDKAKSLLEGEGFTIKFY